MWVLMFKFVKLFMFVFFIFVVVYVIIFVGYDYVGVIKFSVDDIGEFVVDNVINLFYLLKYILWIVCGVFFYGFK